MNEQLAARARQGNLDAWRAVAKATGRELIDRDGILTYFSMAPAANFNPSVVYEPQREPEAALDFLAREYRARSLPFGFEVPAGVDPAIEAAAVERGMTLRSEQPVMVWHPARDLPPPDPRVRAVTFERYDEHLMVAAEGFGDQPDMLRAFAPPEMLHAGMYFTGYDEDGTAAATALTCVTGREAGVFGVATLPAYRRRGLGAAATLAAVRAAVDAGADLVWLHASEMGRPVYERLGFVAVQMQRIYGVADASS